MRFVIVCALMVACSGSTDDVDTSGETDTGALPDAVSDNVQTDLNVDTGSNVDIGEADHVVDILTDTDAGSTSDTSSGDTTVTPDTQTDIVTDTGQTGVTYQPPDPATTFTYLLKLCGPDDPIEVPARIAGETQIAGQSWRRLEVGDFQAETRDGFVSYTRIKDGRYEVIGSDVYQQGNPEPFLSFRFDQPIGGPISGQDGLTEKTSTTGTLCVMDQCDPYQITVTYTLVSSSETIEVAYGKVTDAIHIHFEQTSSDLGEFVLESDWWVKSGIGMIKATEVPGFCGLELKSVTFPAK